MSKYRVRPYDLSGVKTYPLESRTSKVGVELFSQPHTKGESVSDFFQKFPSILAARNLKDLRKPLLVPAKRKRISFGGWVGMS